MQHRLDRWREIARAMLTGNKRSRRRNRRGMSLIEVMVVIAIILTLTSVLAIGIFGIFGEAQAQTTVLTMGKVDQRISLYVLRKKSAPSSLSEAFGSDEVPKDAWGNDFIYEANGRNYEITSLGSDGAPGGTGDATDLKWSEQKQ
ncbi:MAG: type II secretion system protein GspG [Myxococcota bacterium]